VRIAEVLVSLLHHPVACATLSLVRKVITLARLILVATPVNSRRMLVVGLLITSDLGRLNRSSLRACWDGFVNSKLMMHNTAEAPSEIVMAVTAFPTEDHLEEVLLVVDPLEILTVMMVTSAMMTGDTLVVLVVDMCLIPTMAIMMTITRPGDTSPSLLLQLLSLMMVVRT
jgi:hypothetical protein